MSAYMAVRGTTPLPSPSRRSAANPLETSRRRALDLLRSGIRSGAVRDQLVEMTLTKSLFISRNALREALQVLAREGVVYRRPRYGTLVTRPGISIPLDELMSTEDIKKVRVAQQELRRIPANDVIRLQLGGEAESVLLSEQVVYFDGEPMCVRTFYLDTLLEVDDARAMLNVIDATHKSTALAFEEFFHRRLGRIANRIQVVAGDPDGCALLGIPPGSPVLLRETVHVDEEGRPWMIGYSHYRGDVASFSWDA
jgi:GntR family transcriptional regulator